MTLSDNLAFVTDKDARQGFYDKAANPQDNLEHSFVIGIMAWVNSIVPIVLWCVWRGKNYKDPAVRTVFNDNKFYEWGWWAFVVMYPVEWLIPAFTWPFTFGISKYFPVIYASWLLFLVSLTWWAVNLGIGGLWILGALHYKENTVFSKNEIWTAAGAFLAYALIANPVYYWLFHRAADHPVVPDNGEDTNNMLAYGF